MSVTMIMTALRGASPRVWIRTGFLAIFAWSCLQLWRYYQWALGNGPFVERPEATAGFVPLGALLSFAAWLKTGVFDPVMPAIVVIFIAALVLSLLLKRGFCGWICPVGTAVSAIAWVGRRMRGGSRPTMNWALDVALRVPKYLVGAYIVGSVFMLPAEVGLGFQQLPYYATADMKILYGLLHPAWGYLALAAFVTATTLLVGTGTWCRYLCPLGAIYGGVSLASLGTVKRNPERCVGCLACDAACQARVRVASSTRAIRDPECDGCQDCVAACPAPGALETRFAGAAIPWRAWAGLVLATWLLVWGFASATGHWRQGLPDATVASYMRQMKLTHDF